MGRNGTVQLRVVGESPRPPRRGRNIDRRPREYLTPAEVETLMATARKRSRYGHCDATMILIAYRHGLRVSELCRLEWSQIAEEECLQQAKHSAGISPKLIVFCVKGVAAASISPQELRKQSPH
jgi:integrase